MSNSFSITLSDPNVTGLVVVSCYDSRTDFIFRQVLPNDHVDNVASVMAFAGARISRSKDTFEQIFAEVYALAEKAQKRLASIFKLYGHASVAEMAFLFGFLENIPDIYTTKIFYESAFGAGQQRSTRYQDYGRLEKIPLSYYLENPAESLDESFIHYQKVSELHYLKWKHKFMDAYAAHFEIDTQNKKHRSALEARTFDSTRYFLLGGVTTRTSMGYMTQAREWAKIISILKSEPDPKLVMLGEQIEYLFAPSIEYADSIGYTPEAPDLIRYTQSDETTNSALDRLENWLGNNQQYIGMTFADKNYNQGVSLVDTKYQAEKLFATAILNVNPCLNFGALLQDIARLPVDKQRELSDIVLGEYNCYQQLPEWLDTNTFTYELDCSYGEYRDFNRHRVWGRYSPALSSANPGDILDYGLIYPLYLDVDGLSNLKNEFLDDLYSQSVLFTQLVTDLMQDHDVDYLVPHLMPFAQNIKPIMHGSPKNISYFTDRRQRPGGHINYRALAYEMAEVTANEVPLLQGLLIKDPKPDPADRDQFLDRS